VKIAI